MTSHYADPLKAERELGWKAQRGLKQMMQDACRWQSLNRNDSSEWLTPRSKCQ